MAKGAPTLSEFTDLIKKEFDKGLTAYTQQEKDDFFNAQVAQNLIRNRYDSYLEDYSNGEIGDDGFRTGCVGSVAYCLDLMF